MLTVVPMVIFAYDVEVAGIYYLLDSTNKTAQVTYLGQYPGGSVYNSYAGDIVIPESIMIDDVTYSVTAIGDEAFYESEITSVKIPSSVTSIGQGAFWTCINLSDVTLPNSITTIGHSAFECCYSLTSCIIPPQVTVIEDCLFGLCSNLSTIILPDGITSIGVAAFYYCI